MVKQRRLIGTASRSTRKIASALLAREALVEHGEPSAHRFERGLGGTGGDDAEEPDLHGRLAAGETALLLRTLPGRAPVKLDFDVSAGRRLERA